MAKYRYGPLIFNFTGEVDDSGNYYWNGLPAVGYDEMSIPIDENGRQCLPVECPLHPAYEPTETVFNHFLQMDLPTLDSFREWFEDNFLMLTDTQLKKYILRWVSFQQTKTPQYFEMQINYSSIEAIIEDVWSGNGN